MLHLYYFWDIKIWPLPTNLRRYFDYHNRLEREVIEYENFINHDKMLERLLDEDYLDESMFMKK